MNKKMSVLQPVFLLVLVCIYYPIKSIAEESILRQDPILNSNEVEANKKLVYRLFDALELGELKVINHAFDPKGKSIIGSQERPRGGPFKSFSAAAPFPAALDNRSVTVEYLFAEDDKVAVQSKICGLHARTLVGYKATKKKICARYTNLYTIKNGKIIVNAVGFDPEIRKSLEANRITE